MLSSFLVSVGFYFRNSALEEEASETRTRAACFNKTQCCRTPQPDSTFADAISELFETQGKTVVIGLGMGRYVQHSRAFRFAQSEVEYLESDEAVNSARLLTPKSHHVECQGTPPKGV